MGHHIEVRFDHDKGRWAARVVGPLAKAAWQEGWTCADDAAGAFVSALMRLTMLQGDRPGAPQMFPPVQHGLYGRGIADALKGGPPRSGSGAREV